MKRGEIDRNNLVGSTIIMIYTVGRRKKKTSPKNGEKPMRKGGGGAASLEENEIYFVPSQCQQYLLDRLLHRPWSANESHTSFTG
jgi:hypothetical protein